MERLLHARLVGTGGPVEGGVFALAGDEISIGRDPASHLPIEDASVSRQHCLIRKLAADRFEIRDLASRNGTAVNGLPVTERVLGDHDEIRIGACRFLFLLGESDARASVTPVEFDQGRATETLRQFRREEGHVSLAPWLDERADVRSSGSLAVLLKLATGIHMARGTEQIARWLLEGIFEAIPAERGAVLLFEGARDQPAFACSRDRDGGWNVTVRACGEIIARARREGVTILAHGPLSSDSAQSRDGCAAKEGTESDELLPGRERPGTSAERSRRVLAAPIMSQDNTLGVIYLEASGPQAAFDDEHLQLVTAMGGIVGMPFENARRLEWIEQENRRLQDAIDIEHDMVGACPGMREVFQFVAKVAPTAATVLIRGESGTGKELLARAIHRNSPRAGQKFVAINCAALTATLLQSELFGHERGAFTGAMLEKKGKFEVADRGTLFLDEIGDLPLAFQTALLRVLQEREFERVGGTLPIRVDVRLITATNRDLEAAVASGGFRADLYYRLNVVSLTMPPLRDRREDIPLLARHFAAKHSKRAKRRIAGLSPEAVTCLEAYDWPGNVRELENALEHAVVLGSTDFILPEDLPEAILESVPATSGVTGGYYRAVKEEKKRTILAALEQSGGNYAEAAKLLGLHPNYLHRLARNLNLKGEGKKASRH